LKPEHKSILQSGIHSVQKFARKVTKLSALFFGCLAISLSAVIQLLTKSPASLVRTRELINTFFTTTHNWTQFLSSDSIHRSYTVYLRSTML